MIINKRLLKLITCTIALQFFIGCAMPPAAFSFSHKKNETGDVTNTQEKLNFVNICWWCKFKDPYLKDYIIKAIEYNHDLKKASWQTEQYRQFVKYSFGQELPSFSMQTDYLGFNTPSFIGTDITRNGFILPFQAQYEADFLLKNRDKTKSKQEAYKVSKFEEKSAYISIATDVATTYINIMKYDKDIKLESEIVCVKKELLRRNQHQLQRGVISALVVNQAERALRTEENKLYDISKSRQESLNQLAVLIGESPNNSCHLKRITIEQFCYWGQIPDCISSDVIFSRPDVNAAEENLQKSRIDVRVARKEFFPKFNVTGNYVFNTIGSGNFFSWQSSFATLLAGATQDLFTGGRKFATLRIQKSIYEQMFETCLQTNLTAVKEVNDSLFFIKENRKELKNATERLIAETDNYERTKAKFSRGVVAVPEVLKEKELYLTDTQLKLDARTTLLINYLTLYKATGGNL